MPCTQQHMQQRMQVRAAAQEVRALDHAAGYLVAAGGGGLRGGGAASPRPCPRPPPLRPTHLVCGESASSTLSLGPWPSFRVTSCRFSIASAAEEARSNLT